MGRYSYNELNAFGPDGLALELVLKNRNLSKSDAIDISQVPQWGLNTDKVCVKCGNCGQYMRFYKGPYDAIDGKWKCDSCGVGITENRVYVKIENENQKWSDKWLDD